MNEHATIRKAIGASLSALDLVSAFFLVLGGLNAMGSHLAPGFVSVGMGLVLLFLSVGLWTKNERKMIARIVLYAVGACVLGGSLAVLVVFHRMPRWGDNWVVELAAVLLACAALLSLVHLRLTRKEEMNRESLAMSRDSS